MPEQPPSNRPGPVAPFLARQVHGGRRRAAAPSYAELLAASNFSFLRGASHPEELSAAAAVLGLSGLAVVDRNTLAGVVRGHLAARQTGVPFAVGCRLAFADFPINIVAWPTDRAAYGRLCRLLTTGNMRGEKGDCRLFRNDLLEWGEGLQLAALPGRDLAPDLAEIARDLAHVFPGHVRLGASPLYDGNDRRRIAELQALAGRIGVPLVALGDALYHTPDRRPLQDVLSCIREHTTLDNAGRLLEANAERHLKPPEEMARLFADAPDAIAETMRLFDSLAFSLDELRYEYPDEPAGASATPFEELTRLAWEGAGRRYPAGVPQKVKKTIAHELKLIRELDYASYFLTVWDIVRFAREQGILCQGRGSAANSAVCFCLGITEVDPERSDLLFERFVSPERREPPDIDVDFEHERREEVIQYIYEKYGRDRAGIAATIITYRGRSAAREVGKAFGMSEDAVSALAGQIWGWSSVSVDEADAARAGLDASEPRTAKMIALARQIVGFPRHLSQHVGGFVITRGRLDEVVPVGPSAMEGRTIIEWDKDDLDALGMLKIDVLALGMLSCLRRALDLMALHYDRQLTLASIPAEDRQTYDMICRADTVGVFQIESRAQMSMLPRLRPRTFYDLVIEVAIVRPGPIQGDMVHPYLRRRQGLEEAVYPAPAPEHGPANELEQVLGKTLGVPLFQEQAMKIAIVAAGFTPAEADRLRRAMATFRRVGTIHSFQEKMVAGMVARGYDAAFAERCFRQIEGFGEYGFPESHAASFALLVYASAWMKCHYPDVFCAALLNAQPMGFYAPAQIVRDAREHGVEVREVDVNRSAWDAGLEELAPPPPLRGRDGEGGRKLPPPLFPHAHVSDEERGTAKRLRRDPTKAEALIWRELRAHRLDGLGFRRQVPMGRFVADFVCHAAKVVVELDGEAHRGREARDLEREAWFQSRGYRTLRFGNEDVLTKPEKTLAEIKRVCAERLASASQASTLSPPLWGRAGEGGKPPPYDPSPLPDPPPQGGRELRIHPRHGEQAPAIWTRCAVRLGLRQVKGLRQADAARLVEARGERPYASVRELWLRAGLSRAALERLAEADCFRSMGLDRRQALWQVRGLDEAAPLLPLFTLSQGERVPRTSSAPQCAAQHPGAERRGEGLRHWSNASTAATPHPAASRPPSPHGRGLRSAPPPWATEPDVALPEMPLGEHVVSDYRALSLSLKAHPVSFLRERLAARGIVASERLAEMRSGRRVTVAGLVLVRQRPGSAAGVLFATIEDETGVANIIVWPKVFESHRGIVMGARLIAVSGRLQSESGVIHVVAERLEDLSPLLAHLAAEPIGQAGLANADEVRRPVDDAPSRAGRRAGVRRLIAEDPAAAEDVRRLIRDSARAMPKGRNFR
jgi:error-prone DNA polymerase